MSTVLYTQFLTSHKPQGDTTRCVRVLQEFSDAFDFSTSPSFFFDADPTLVSTFLLPLLFGVSMGVVNMRRITTDAANKLELLPFTLVIIVWCFVGYAGGFLGYRMAHMWAPAPALRVNLIARPLEPVPLLARVVSLVMGGTAYVAVAFPFFWVINASWGAHATTGAALVLATGIAGCAVIVVGSILSLLGGILPAYKAAKMEPVDAMALEV